MMSLSSFSTMFLDPTCSGRDSRLFLNRHIRSAFRGPNCSFSASRAKSTSKTPVSIVLQGELKIRESTNGARPRAGTAEYAGVARSQ